MTPAEKMQLEHEGNRIAANLAQKIREARVASGHHPNYEGQRQDTSGEME